LLFPFFIFHMRGSLTLLASPPTDPTTRSRGVHTYTQFFAPLRASGFSLAFTSSSAPQSHLSLAGKPSFSVFFSPSVSGRFLQPLGFFPKVVDLAFFTFSFSPSRHFAWFQFSCSLEPLLPLPVWSPRVPFFRYRSTQNSISPGRSGPICAVVQKTPNGCLFGWPPLPLYLFFCPGS